MYNIATVAANIKNARLRRNYSQDYLAAKLHISQNAYSKVELGQTRVTVERLNIIADVLEVKVSSLIDIGDVKADIAAINRLTIVPKLLEIICHSTGMGFAAIARVTSDKWVACSVRDEINFGMVAGNELKLETTICRQIRQDGKAVIIDEVSKDEAFCNDPIPVMYGFQSYISVPILRSDGSFFGTLCAIDPKPAKVNNPETISLFKLFTELISFHLDLMDEEEPDTLPSNILSV